MNSEPATKVAIIGGGCASITTAFELSRPEHRGRFDITVYQVGWRLGGKGASGRGPSGRIEEHGLHVWLGFYENAFRLLRECYAELAADPGGFDVGDWRDAFVTDNATGLSARSQDGSWHNWSVCFPARDGLPGDPISGAELFSVRSYVSGALDMLGALLQTVDSRRSEREAGEPGFLGREPPLSAASMAGDPQRILSAISDLVGGAFAATTAVMTEALAVLEAGLQMLPSPLSNPLTNLAEWIAHSLRQQLEKRLITEPYFQHVWEMMDVVVASVVGILRFNLLTDPRGFDAIDDYDWREWLCLNGASRHSVQSPFIRGLYDLVLAYDDGDPKRPRLSAASAVRGSFRLFFTYRGAFQWKLRAGMGDVVFAPFYEVLRRRGVKFAFFHRLTNVRLSSDAESGEPPFVAALDFDVQANVKAGADYSPLISVKGRPCWPSTPDFSQLANGRRMASEGREFESHWDSRRVATKTLEVAKDFDFVVLGLSVAAIPYVCAEILARDPRWRRMVEEIKTVETQAFQIWLDQDLEEIGWRGPNVLGAAFIEPFDTWCDLAHSIPEEAWVKPPKTVLYFCGVLPEAESPARPEDPSYPELRRADVRRNALTHLRDTGRFLWPNAYDASGEFRWDMLREAEAPGGDGAESPSGAARFDAQYWRANVNPSDRYVLSVPGSAKYRLSPLDMTYDNMTIAGDWTACGIDGGCVEAAVISGRLAAHALAGAPRLEDIVGYDHP